MKNYVQQIDRTCASIMAVAFVGIHVPMVSLILFGIVNSFTGLGPVFLTILAATMISTVASIVLIWRFTRESDSANPA